jgi:hypothetical protein
MKIHHLSTTEAFASMQSAPSGLSSQEALRRLAEYGRNEVENEHLSASWLPGKETMSERVDFEEGSPAAR